MVSRALLLIVVGCGRVGFDAGSDAATAGDGVPSDGALPSFVDMFDRADASSLGNGWTEKNAGTYAISSQHVVRTDFSRDYRDSLVYRPAAEDLRDVLVSIEFTVGHVPPGYPQIHARVQRSTIATANTLDGYLLYIDGTAGNGYMQADITRQHGTTLPPPLATFQLSPQLAVGGTYRLRLAVRGTAPVMLDGSVEQLNGTLWTVIGSVVTTDTDPTAVVTPGAIGFDVGQPEQAGYYTYDAFGYAAL